jgi:hypothetical protein
MAKKRLLEEGDIVQYSKRFLRTLYSMEYDDVQGEVLEIYIGTPVEDRVLTVSFPHGFRNIAEKHLTLVKPCKVLADNLECKLSA